MYFKIHAIPKKLSIFSYSELQCEVLCWLMLWSVICKIIPWGKWIFYVICRYSFMHVASENVCTVPKLSWSIYDISILLCSMSESTYFVSKNPFACFNSFVTWASIAHSVSIFVASRVLCCIAKSMHYAQNYMLHEQIYLLTFGDNYYWVISLSLWSNLHEVPYMN